MRSEGEPSWPPGRAGREPSAGRFFADVTIDNRGTNAPELPRAEKTIPAGVTAVRRKSKPALQHNHRPGFHSLARDMLQVEVAAPRTMSVALKRGGHAPTVETVVASVAPPRPQADHAAYEIEYAAAVGSKRIRTTTLRANHRHPAVSESQNTENHVPRQDRRPTDVTTPVSRGFISLV
jgi:hypothetical protein